MANDVHRAMDASNDFFGPSRKKGYFQFKTLDQAERCYQRVAGRKEKASDAHKKGR